MATTLSDFTILDNSGAAFPLNRLDGRVVLIVNTASHCGFTPQYAGLQRLHERYQAQGLTVLGVPCDQFGHQEPGSDAEIGSFCQRNYGVSFPLAAKTFVNGKQAHPLFQFLKNQAPHPLGKTIKWNFTKFLVARDGQTVHRFEPLTAPQDLEATIQELLAQ